MEPYNPASQQKVKEALAWAYRTGYSGAEAAAEEFALANGLRVVKSSLGSYGETIDFQPQVIHMTRDAVTTLCGQPAAGAAINAHYGDRELDRGTWCEECAALRAGGAQ